MSAVRFLRFIHFGDGTTAAEFEHKFSAFDERPMRFNRESLGKRIENLEREGHDASIERSVLESWEDNPNAQAIQAAILTARGK